VILALVFGLSVRPSDPQPGPHAGEVIGPGDGRGDGDGGDGPASKCRTHVPHTSAPRTSTSFECPTSDQPLNCPAG